MQLVVNLLLSDYLLRSNIGFLNRLREANPQNLSSPVANGEPTLYFPSPDSYRDDETNVLSIYSPSGQMLRRQPVSSSESRVDVSGASKSGGIKFPRFWKGGRGQNRKEGKNHFQTKVKNRFMKNVTEPKIGELQCPDGHGQRLATLPCDLPRATPISLMFLDGQGRMMCEKTFNQPKGISQIEMRLPRLRGGKYNVWVEVEGGILIREVEIAERKKTGWLARLREWVSDGLQVAVAGLYL